MIYKNIDGIILIWSDIDANYKTEFLKNNSFTDVISLTNIIKDLNDWEDQKYLDYIKEKEYWLGDLFGWLKNEKLFR